MTCGATRAAIAFFHLDFWSAWKWNPLVFTVLCGLSIFDAYAFFHLDFWSAWKWNPLVFTVLCGLSIFDAYAFSVLVVRAPRLRIAQFTPAEKGFLRLIAITLLLSNWIYLLSRPPTLF